jgi:hypothetical protein
MMDRGFGWVALALVAFAGISGALMFRYEPLTLQSNPMEITVVWDRWSHRVCMIGHSTGQRMVCTLDEMDQFGRPRR